MFSGPEPLLFIQVAPQLTSRGWVDPVPDPLLFRKSGSAGNRTRDLCICSQKLWSLDHRRVTVLNTVGNCNTMISKRWSVPVTGPVVAQRVGRRIALLFHDRATRKGWVVSSTPRPYFTPGKHPVPIVQKAGWATGPVWTGGKSRPNGIRSPNRPARSSVAIPIELPDPPIIL